MSSDICKNKDDPTAGCPTDLPKDPKNTCEAIKTQYDVMIQQSKDYVKALKEAGKAFSLAGLLEELGARNKSNVKLQNVINSINTSTQDIESESKCGNKTTNVQQNIIGDTACMEIQERIIKSLIGTDQLGRYIETLGTNRTEQVNSAESKQQCVLNNYIAAALKQDGSIESTALLKVMQQSSDLFASSESEVDMCNNVNSTISSCQYIKSKLCCVNEMNSTQLNLIKCGQSSDVFQKNENAALQICNLTGSTTVDASLIAKLKSGVSVSLSQTATGTSMMWFVIFIALFILGPPLGVGLFSLFLPKEIVVAFFGIICIVIGIVLWNIYKPLPSPPEFINKTRDKPIFAAKDYKPNSSYKPTAQTEIKSIKYGAAKKICLDDKNCRAMDFSITKIKDNQEITDDNVGIPVFYNSIKDEYCEEDIEDTKNTYFTSYKYPTPTPYDIYGKILIGVGAVLILMAMYLLFKSSKNKTNTRI
jgi:hypothetical protein